MVTYVIQVLLSKISIKHYDCAKYLIITKKVLLNYGYSNF
jgi:hypothetical protein